MQDMENKDEMLKSFFREQKKEIADYGFSRRVTQKLPAHRNREWIVWSFALVGLTVSLIIGLHTGFIIKLIMWLFQLPFYYILGGLFCFPLLSIPLIFIKGRKSWF